MPEIFPFAIIQRIAFVVGDNPLLAQGQVAADEIRAVFGDFNLRVGLRIFFHGEFTVARLMKLSRACQAKFVSSFKVLAHGHRARRQIIIIARRLRCLASAVSTTSLRYSLSSARFP